jgi:hypothetical protein
VKRLLLIIFLITVTASYAQESKPTGKFNGVLFGDYFYKIDGDSSGSAGQYSPYGKDIQGFSIRRTRLHYEHYFNENFTGNFGVEANDVTKIDSKMSFILYDANFEWKNVVPNSTILFGLMPTPMFVWGMSEKMYGYRGVEKTFADKNGLGSAVDIGVALRGTFDKEGKSGYMALIGNGKGLKPEVSKYLKFYGQIYTKFFKDFVTEVYFDYQSGINEQYRYTIKSVVGYKAKHNEFTFEPVFQCRNNAINSIEAMNPSGFSLHTKYNILRKTDLEETEVINLFARYDYFDPNSNTSKSGFKENFFNVGVDFLPFPNFHLIPNLWLTTYKDKSGANISRPSDVVARMTFWFVY